MKKLPIIVLFCLSLYNSGAQDNYADSLNFLLSQTTQPVERFNLLNKIVDDIFMKGSGNMDYSSCIQMVRIAQQLDNDSLLAIGYNSVGNFFLINNGDYSSALEYFFKGIPLAEKANDKRRLSSLYIDIAVVYHNLHNPDEQIKYLHKAVENLPDISSPLYYFMLVQTQVYTSRYFILKNKYDSALHYAFATIESNKQLKSPIYACAAQALLGNIYSHMNDTLLAESHFQNALRIADSVEYIYIKRSAKTQYVEFLLKTLKIITALEQARQLMSMGIEKNNADIKRTAAGFLRNISEHLYRLDSAYYYSKMELEMKDSVFNQQDINKVQSLAFKEQLRIIEEEARRAAEEERRKHNIQYAFLALCIITFTIIFLLVGQRFIINERLIRFLIVVGLLLVFEFINLVIHPFLGQITHHSPGLMLLAMVGIAALLVPLHHRLQKWVTNIMVEKNKRIRLAIAKKTITNREKNNL